MEMINGWFVIGNCPTCGCPIFAKEAVGENPPVVRKSCSCSDKPDMTPMYYVQPYFQPHPWGYYPSICTAAGSVTNCNVKE